MLIGRLHAEGISVKALNVGSMGGLAAAKRGECDIAPIHLMDPESGEYNRPFLTPALELVPGYRRLQGIVYRKDDRASRAARSRARSPRRSPTRIADGQPQCRQRHPHPDRSPAQGRPAAGLLVAAEIAQRRRRRGRPEPRRLGDRDRKRGSAIRPRLHPGRRTSITISWFPGPGSTELPVVRFRALLADPAMHAALTELGFAI